MYVGPRCSKAGRSRRDSPARDPGVPRSFASPQQQCASEPVGDGEDPAHRGEVVRVDEGPGQLGGLAGAGVSMSGSPSWAERHGMASGSTIHGASWVKAPMARSAGSSGPGTYSRWAAGSVMGTPR